MTDRKTQQMRILIIEDHRPTRDEMRAMIERQPDMTVVGEAETGEDGIKQACETHPDVVMMDILLPGINGIEATRRILVAQPSTKILAVSNHFGESLIQTILASGGLGYVRKNRALEELIPALRSVAAGKQYIGGRPAGANASIS
jgi:DNA-binding NarL/FixJ family response regulator